MQHNPLVYIIVLTWNGKSDTLDCLVSLKNLFYPNYRIVVVDNASTDGTVEELKLKFPDVHIICNKSNLRFAGGNNEGIKFALSNSAEYILLLNNDTLVEKNFLSELIEAIEDDKNVGMAGPKIYYHSDPNRIWYAGGVVNWWNGSTSHVGVREIDNGQFNGKKYTGYITGCAILVKREVIEKVGMLDESYYIYGEDTDWSIRAIRAGFYVLFVPKSVIWHKVSVSTGGHFSWFKNWNKLKSQFRILTRYAKFYHWLTIPVLFPLSILFSFIKSKVKN